MAFILVSINFIEVMIPVYSSKSSKQEIKSIWCYVSRLKQVCRTVTDMLTKEIKAHKYWATYTNVFTHPQASLRSGKPTGLDTANFDVAASWREVWTLANVVNKPLVSDPAIQQQGFKLSQPTFTAPQLCAEFMVVGHSSTVSIFHQQEVKVI